MVVVLSSQTCTVEALIIVMLGSVVDITIINMDLFKKKKKREGREAGRGGRSMLSPGSGQSAQVKS